MSQIRDMLLEELQDGAKVSKQFIAGMDEAKTKTKKIYYKKKLQKNNEKNAKIVMALQRLEEVKEKNDEYTSDDSK